ncbi:TIGR00341 family protein [Psychrobacter sp. AOP22-C1-C5]|uniref:TIGR00341 family protein n=1 Tax=Psychrobacter sp. AOP22-C1-C5 TaxID=3457716 RepID=UPI00403651B3
MTKSEKSPSDQSIMAQDSVDAAEPNIESNSLTESTTDDSILKQMVVDDPNEPVEDTACAKVPKAKVKMESIAPNVVVASLETSDSDTGLPESESQVLSEQASSNEEVIALDDEALETPQTQVQDQDLIAPEPTSEHLASNPSTTDQGREPQQDDEKEEEEEVKEKKEAKLESYKQFVAEQFNNKKVDYPEVRVTIEANALPSKMYFIMNILSAIIASYGLVTNSAAVVIGAMLVAMMLGPITGVALAIIDHRMPLLRRSIITVLIGVSLVILVGFIIGWLHKDQPLTAEILSRTQPTSMDLMIALAGGTAGAYAMVSPHLSVAVVGVAVATALVPPLAASGILFANGEIQLGFGALLLAVTNIIAIQFTNALVLWVLGFRRLVDEEYQSNTYLTFLQRNAVTLLLLGGLGTYLTINLQTNAKQQAFENNVKEAINTYFIDKGNVLTNTQFDTIDKNQVIRAVIRGETTPTSYDVRQIESAITKDMAENFPNYLPVKLQLRYLPVQVIEADPLIQDKLDETDATILTN